MQDLWQELTPNKILDSIESILEKKLTNLCLPRNSYINRVYEIEDENCHRYIVKFYRPHRWQKDVILGEHAFLKKCAAIDIPVIPPIKINQKTLFESQSIFFAIFPKMGGRVIDELYKKLWEETGRLLARVHNVGNTMIHSKRIEWTPEIATKTHFESLLQANIIPDNYVEPLTNAITQFITKSLPLFKEIDLSLIHGDCHFGNIIYRPDESLYLVDFDDCVVGPPIQDFWMLLPDALENCQQELNWFQNGYTVFREFPVNQLKLIPALKIMRQIHFAAWCAIQSKDLNFKHHFPEWGSIKYWNELTRDVFGYY